jgi:hypothetical protein
MPNKKNISGQISKNIDESLVRFIFRCQNVIMTERRRKGRLLPKKKKKSEVAKNINHFEDREILT